MLIGGFARQVRRTLPKKGKEAEKLALIEEEAKRLESMLEEVRDFTRPAAPKMTGQDLNATVWDTVMLLETNLASRGITLRTNLDVNLPPAIHDPSQIRQVLINLIKNAAEAMPNGGLVVVGTRLNRSMVEVEVRDDGPGITPGTGQDWSSIRSTPPRSGGPAWGCRCATASSTTTAETSGWTPPGGRDASFVVSLPVEKGL